MQALLLYHWIASFPGLSYLQPLQFISQVIKNWRWEKPGKEATIGGDCRRDTRLGILLSLDALQKFLALETKFTNLHVAAVTVHLLT